MDRSYTVRNLAHSDWATGTTITVPYTFKVGTKQQTVVVPSTYSSVSGKDVNKVGVINFTNSQGYISQYRVFVAPVGDGLSVESLITITISK